MLQALLTVCLVAAAAEPTGELLVNGSFESVGRSGSPQGWRFADYRTGARGSIAEVGQAEGASGRCVTITTTAARQRGAWQQKVQIQASAGLKVRLYYKTRLTGGSPGACVRVTWLRDCDGWPFIGDKTVRLKASETWRQAELKFIAPREARCAAVELFNFYGVGTVWFDEVSVTMMSADEKMAELQSRLDAPPGARQVGYRPSDGESVGVTPPSFVWVPVAGYRYAVQWSRDPSFSQAEEERDLELSIYTPPRPLAPGRWYWRYGLDLGETIVWSKVRTFVVPKAAPELPLDLKQLVGHLPPGHPRLWVREDELAAWRQRVADDPAFARVLRQADSLLGVDPSTIPEPRPYTADEKRKTAKWVARWRAMRRDATTAAHRAWLLGLAYMGTGESKYGEAGRRWLLHVCSWDPAGTSSLKYNDEAGMPMLYSIPRAYDWLYPVLTEEDRAAVHAAYRARGEEAYRILRGMPFHSNPYSSHPGRFINFLGEGAICFYGEIPEAEKWLDYILRCYVAVYPAWGGRDGGWAEGPNYWKWYIQRTFTWLFAARTALGIHIERRPFFRNTGYFKLYTNPPNSGMSPFGDAASESRPNAADKTILWHVGELYGEPAFKWYAEQVKGDLAFPLHPMFCGPEKVRARPPADLPDARLFSDIGVAAMHSALEDPTSDIMLLLKSSPYGSYSHSHADQNAFYLQAGGEPLFIDSGYYPWYSSPHHHNWTRETKAHNCITYDGGHGQVKRSKEAQGRILDFATGPDFHYAVGDATQAYGGALNRFIRRVVFARPDVVFIFDDVASDEARRWEWWLHALQPMEIDRDAQAAVARSGNAWARCTLLWPRNLSFHQFTGFEPPPEYDRPDQSHMTATVASPSKAEHFLAVITVAFGEEQRAQPRLERAANYLGARLAVGGGELVCAFRTAKGEIRAGRVHADAPVIAARYDAHGKLVASFVAGGERVNNDATCLLASSQPGTFSIRFLDGLVIISAQADEAFSLTARVPDPPRYLLLDGQPAPESSWQWKSGSLTISLPAGSHVLAISCDRQLARPGSVHRVPILIDGDEIGHIELVRSYDSAVGTARLRLAGPLLCRPSVEFLGGRAPEPGCVSLSIDKTPIDRWRRSRSLLIARRRISLADSSIVDLCVRCDLSQPVPLRAVVLKDALRPVEPRRVKTMPAQGIVIEAEDFVDEGLGRCKISRGEHLDQHGGASIYGNIGDGHWLEWEFEVPQAGEYDLFVRAACGARYSLREVRLDGRLPAKAFALIKFPNTGGWAHEPGQWWAFHVAGSASNLPPLRLSAGKHRLRVRGMDAGHLNLDYFVLRRR